jgi:hypothetical protein
MDLIRSVPIYALVMTAVWLLAVSTRAQSMAETPDIKVLRQHAEIGDCGYLDQFTDNNIKKSGALGIAARIYALDALTKESAPPPSQRVCRYHDRRTALLVAVRLYEASAGSMAKSSDEVVVSIALSGALGNSWRDKLAHAGVRPAMQDLVALHLLCVRKDNEQRAIPFWERKDGELRPLPFWEWMLRDPQSGSRFEFFDRLLED